MKDLLVTKWISFSIDLRMKTAFEVGFSKIMNYFQIISLTMRVQNHNAGGRRETHYRVIRAWLICVFLTWTDISFHCFASWTLLASSVLLKQHAYLVWHWLWVRNILSNVLWNLFESEEMLTIALFLMFYHCLVFNSVKELQKRLKL